MSKLNMNHCPSCCVPLVYKCGIKNKPYYSHKPSKQILSCRHFKQENEEHLIAKQTLYEILLQRRYCVHLSRQCRKCSCNFLFEIEPLPESYKILLNYSFQFNELKRTADIVCLNEKDEIEFILEICNRGQMSCERRPEPWYEISATEIVSKISSENYAETKTKIIILNCLRRKYSTELTRLEYGFCQDCELKPYDGTIYFNQRGAGCGKTYESIQLIQTDQRFKNKNTFLYLTKMHSAREVIYSEFIDQFENKQLFANTFQIVEKNNIGKQYIIRFKNIKTQELCTAIIGTIDSFTYAIQNRNKIESKGEDFFMEIVRRIRNHSNDNPELLLNKENRTIQYAQGTMSLTEKTLVIIDEGQDLEQTYIEAFQNIITFTGIDTYVIGDKLQSILSENNLFTYLEKINDNPSTNICLKKDIGKNIVKRFHCEHFQSIVNHVVKYEKFGLEPITGICDGRCKYQHSSENPLTINTKFPNIFSDNAETIQATISYILRDMEEKANRHHYLPNNFCFIFPVVNYKNVFIPYLLNAVQNFWIRRFIKPETFTPELLSQLEKNPYWEHLFKNRQLDKSDYRHCILHRSEPNKSINLAESVNSTRIMSIHASKGTGCECIYLLGLSEQILGFFTGGNKDSLVYESLLHVGLTRQKKYLYVGYNEYLGDDICERFKELKNNL
jgi:Competence protein CoiA-like family